MPIVIAKNQTGSDIDLTRLGLRVPAAGQRTLTEFASYTECTEDASLEAAVTGGSIVINDGTSDLSTAQALVYLNSSGNLNGPATGIAANVLLKLADTTGRATVATGVTIDASNNITTTGSVSAASVNVGGSPLSMDDLSDADTTTQTPTSNDDLYWNGTNWVPRLNTQTSTDPTVNNDNTQGYVIGSRWINTATDAIYIATDVSTGAAVWTRSDSGGAKPYSDIAEASTLTTTTATIPVQMNGMTLTPPAGTYLVWLSADVFADKNNTQAGVLIYLAGSVVPNTERIFTFNSSNGDAGMTTQARVTVNGSQAIQGYWVIEAGSNPTLSALGRSLMIVAVT